MNMFIDFKNLWLLLFVCLIATIALAMLSFPIRQTFEHYAKSSLDEFKELLSLANDAHYPSGHRKKCSVV